MSSRHFLKSMRDGILYSVPLEIIERILLESDIIR